MSAEDAVAALARFEAALVRAQHPLISEFRSPLDPDEIRGHAAEVGIRLPEDAVALWNWHDGMDPGVAEALPGGPVFLRLSDALKDYSWTLENFPFTDLDDWSRDWFPAFAHSNGDTIYLDCSAPDGGATALQYRALKDYNWPEDRRRRRIGSLAEAIDVMTALVERGLWAVDPRVGRYELVRAPDPDLPVAWLIG